VAKNHHHKLVLSLRSESKISLSSHQNVPQKASSKAPMAPKKQIVTLNSATSKGKVISIIGGTVPPLAIDQPYTIEDTGSSSPQEVAANIQAPHRSTKTSYFKCSPT